MREHQLTCKGCMCLQSLTADLSQLGIVEELSPQSVGRLWNRFAAAMHERDMALQAEIVRFVTWLLILNFGY